MKTAVIIPVYNHAERIEAVIRAASSQALPLIVVDDGSRDGCRERLSSLDSCTLLSHPRNLGKGAALLTGFAEARRQGCERAVTLDGDGQHDPADIPALLAAADRAGRAIVVGRRCGMEEGHVPLSSRFGRGFSNFWVWVAGGPRISDSQSGFRLYPLPEVLELGVQARRYQYEVEVLVRARRRGLAVIETPVSVHYQPKGERISHFRPWVDFWRNSATFQRLIFERLFGGDGA